MCDNSVQSKGTPTLAVAIAVPLGAVFVVFVGIIGWLFVVPRFRTRYQIWKQNKRGIGYEEDFKSSDGPSYGEELDNLNIEKKTPSRIHTAAGRFSVHYN